MRRFKNGRSYRRWLRRQQRELGTSPEQSGAGQSGGPAGFIVEPLEPRLLLSATNPLELSSLLAINGGDGTVGYVINGVDVGDQSGRSVSRAGDVNGDGFDDLIIGARYADPNGAGNTGESYVVFGKASGFAAGLDLSTLDGTNGFVIRGIDAYDSSGISVSSAGDVNGDGFADLIIGADAADPNGNNRAGESYVIFGKASGFTASFDLSTLDGTNGFVINGIDADDRSGLAISGAGDINGDGFDDLIIGARYAQPNGKFSAGESYVVFGKASGFAASLNLSALDGTNGFVLNGIVEGDRSGLSVSDAGDVNGDGFADLVIGAFRADPNGNFSAGESYVVFGKASGFAASIELSSLDGTNGFVINGIDAFDLSGFSVSSAGDINGDGFDDLIIGAYLADPNTTSYAGETYVVFGKASGFTASIELSSLDGTNGFVINGIDASDYSGGSVSGAGDINGDGFDDLIIGARRADPNTNNDAGETYVVFGKASGFTASFNLSSLDGTNGFVLNGIDAVDYSGFSVSGAGDINGDGFDDLVIGANLADPNGNNYAGETYVIFGGDFTGAVTQNGTNGSDTLTGSAAVDVLVGGQGADELIGNGGADVLRGGEGDDILAIVDPGFAKIVGGNGTDTLRLDATGLTLDLTAIADNRITGIETIDIAGTGPNTLALNALEVLNLSDTSNTLIVIGDADDTLDFGTGWTLTGSELIGLDTFDVYTQGAATVKVSEAVLFPIAGDLDGNGFVDILDLNIVLSNWNTDGSADPRADTDGSGLVDIIDLNVVLTDWNQGTPPGTGGTIVSEPETQPLSAEAQQTQFVETTSQQSASQETTSDPLVNEPSLLDAATPIQSSQARASHTARAQSTAAWAWMRDGNRGLSTAFGAGEDDGRASDSALDLAQPLPDQSAISRLRS